jgi:PKD repeat protein
VSRQITSVVGDPEASFNFTLGGCNEDAVFIDESTSANGAIVAWNWNFDDPESNGSNTSNIQNPLHLFVSNQSTFNIELSVEDEMGCVGSVDQLIEPFSTTKISGTVISSQGDTIRSGYVLAFLYSNGVISTQVDSVQIISDGSFTCNGLATCVEYIFHGYAEADNYPGLIPRWHYDAFYWFDATPVTVNWGDQIVEGVDINVFELVPPPQGNSSLSGGVFYFNSKGEPVKNVDVVLEYDAPDDKGDEIVGYDPTNEFGAWGFDALGEGVFKIRVDIPGLSMDSVYTITITAPDTHITGLNYYLDPETGIYIDFTGLDELEDMSFGSIGVMPNPSNGQFYLEILKAEHRADLDIQAIELWDMDGRLVKDLGIDFRGQHLITHMNLSDVEAGMYFIKVKNRGEVGIAKIVIQH